MTVGLAWACWAVAAEAWLAVTLRRRFAGREPWWVPR